MIFVLVGVVTAALGYARWTPHWGEKVAAVVLAGCMTYAAIALVLAP